MRRSLMLIPFTITLGTPVLGDVPVPQDFAFGFTVESEVQGAIFELEVPDAIYRRVTRRDLGDIRVFNSEDQIVPHALRLPGTEPREVPAPVEVPFFPLYMRDDQDTSGQMLRIITDEKGTIVDTATTVYSSGEAGRIFAYLLDTSGLEHSPARLRLAWEQPEDSGFAVTIGVTYSDDLSHWHNLVSTVTLADLQSGEDVLVHNEIELPERKARYLRITWPEALRAINLTDVRASFSATGQSPPRRWLTVPGVPDKDDPRAFEYDTGGHWPVDRARMEFAQSNVVLNAVLMSRSGQETNWNPRYRGIFYALKYQGTALESEPAVFVTTSDRNWRFKLEDKERYFAATPPTLLLSWVPHVLTFVAQGTPPYTVAFGSARIAAAARPVDELLRSIDEEQEKGLIVKAKASSIFTLGGETKLEPPATPFPWKTFILWSVLLAGVAMLAWMVRNLFYKMNTPSNTP